MQQEMLYHAVKIMLDRGLIESSVSLETSSNFSKNLDSTPTSHANKTTNSSNCSMALEALTELEGRSYPNDNGYPSNSVNRSNCIDKGEFLQNLESRSLPFCTPTPCA